MKNSNKKWWAIALIACTNVGALFAQDVLFQGWYWGYPTSFGGKKLVRHLNEKLPELHDAGFTHIWLPPLSAGSAGAASMGYDIKDYFDVGQYTSTRWGIRSNVTEFKTNLNNYGMKMVGDLVYNHRDGGKWENNDAVKGWVVNMNYDKIQAGDAPYPSDRFRAYLPIGGNTGRGTGVYYLKIKSASNHPNFTDKFYFLTAWSNAVPEIGGANLAEGEPNGGGDCGQPNMVLPLGKTVSCRVDNPSGCNIDEFAITIDPSQFNAAGDTIWFRMNNYKQLSGGSFGGADLADMSDHFIYGMWYAPGSGNGTAIPANSFTYQTLTDHTSQPSGRGDMSALNFRPNGSPTCLCGDPDGMMFFYDLDQSYPATRDTLHAYTKYFFENIGIGGMRVDAVKHFSPKFMGDLLDYLYDNGYAPDLVVGESYDYSTQVLSNWVNAVLAEMDTDTKQNIQPRIFDFSLRENIRRACDETTYDSRWLFESSIADAAGMSGTNIVTFVNNHDFREAAQIIHNDPVLGYAYILTNNKLGLPTVFYPDFYGGNNERGKIKGLMKVHKNYIFGANTVHYLNKTGQGFSGNWISGRNDKSLLYQIRGGVGGRDVVVAINFDTAPLKVDHTIATVNFSVGDTLTDIFNVSPNPLAFVNSQNQIYMEVPPHSFGVWVQGDLRNQTIDLADSTFSVSSISIPNELPNITVYPNPFNKHLNIEWEATESGTATAVLFNMMGQAVTEQKLSVTEGIKQYTMFLSPTLPSGMYFLQLTLNGKMVTQKVIRE